MLSIAIYTNNTETIQTIKSTMQDFLIQTKTMAKISCFKDAEQLILSPNRFDIYFLDIDFQEGTIDLGTKLHQIDAGADFVYISADKLSAYESSKAKGRYFLLQPIEKKEVYEIIFEVRQKIKADNIIIRFHGGERRIRSNMLNYVNIVKRCMCYHLTDGTMFDGQVLRTSFERAIEPFDQLPSMLFLPPSLLINLSEIKIINSDNIVFENGEVLHFPVRAGEIIRKAWTRYNTLLL